MTANLAKTAAIAGSDGATAQALLAEMAAQWRAGGVKIVGVTAEGHGLPGRTCGAGFLREIASGRAHTIYLDAPSSDTSCHLDGAGVADAGMAIVEQIPASNLVILNKFGKLEAMGKGLATAFKAAIAAGKPLLTTVSEKHRGAWSNFALGAIFLTADKAALQDWWLAVQSGRQQQEEQLFRTSRHSVGLR